MMDEMEFRRTVAALAEYVINLAVHELALEHSKAQNALCCTGIPVSPRRVTFSPFVKIREIEEDEDEPVYIQVIKKYKKRKGAGCCFPLWRLIKKIFGKKQYYLDED